MFSTPETVATTDRAAWLQAMLDFEAALVLAQAEVGAIPDGAARAIAGHCRAAVFDAQSIAERAVPSATPVIPLVRDLTALVDDSAAPYVHRGATSQDVLDTAAMLIAARALDAILADLYGAAAECARLAREHRTTLLIGRSLLQQALPTTFGRKCAGWLVALIDAITVLRRVRHERLAVQLGGPAGTLASLGPAGTRVVGAVARRLGLAEPLLPWHTDRSRIGELAGALGTASGTLGKIAWDVELHAQTEVGELTEGAAGGSSAMPHKQNPAGSVLVTAATKRVPGLVATLLASMPQEHERAAGSWQAEWETLTDLLRLVGSAAAGTRKVLSGLRVHTDRMRRNVDLTGGLVLAESAATALTSTLGRTKAQDLVAQLCRRAVDNGTALRTELLAEPAVRAVLSESDIIAATEPADYLGSVGEFIDRAITRFEEIP